MVRNKLCWDANNAVELSKQRNSYQSSPTFLCFGSFTALFASQHNLFRTMRLDRAKGLFALISLQSFTIGYFELSPGFKLIFVFPWEFEKRGSPVHDSKIKQQSKTWPCLEKVSMVCINMTKTKWFKTLQLILGWTLHEGFKTEK